MLSLPGLGLRHADLLFLTCVVLQPEKGGDPAVVRASQKKRGAPESIVDEVLTMYKEWTQLDFQLNQLQKDGNAVQKDITARKKAKENADDVMEKKKEIDKKVADLKPKVSEAEQKMRLKASTIGNIVGDKVPLSMTEDENQLVRDWHPDGPNAKAEKRSDILSHHEVMMRLDAFDMERGAKISGHRGFFLVEDGVDLNQALINYGLDFLRKKGYKKIMAPFMMRKDVMSKTAQLDEFDEALYRVRIGGHVRTSCQDA